MKKIFISLLLLLSLSTISFSNKIVRINYDNLNIRDYKTKKVIKKAFKGEEYNLIAKLGSWYKVKLGDKEALIHSYYAVVIEKDTSVKREVRIKYNNLNIRDYKTKKVIKKAFKDERYKFISKQDNWLVIEVDSKKAIVHPFFVELIEKKKFKTFVVEIKFNGLNARKEPQKQVVKKLKKGELYPYVKTVDGWFEILVDNKPLYVHPAYVSLKTNLDNNYKKNYGKGFIDSQNIKNPYTIKNVNKTSLVNKFNRLPINFKPVSLKRIVSNSREIYLEEEAANHYEMMRKDALKKGIRLVVFSGYRSANLQRSLYWGYYRKDRMDAIYYSAYPRSSEHETGYAIDISYNSSYPKDFYNTAHGKYLKENAHKYGFILRYTKEKEAITNYKAESWHYRYVGIDLAKILKENNITLEEYYGVN